MVDGTVVNVGYDSAKDEIKIVFEKPKVIDKK